MKTIYSNEAPALEETETFKPVYLDREIHTI